MTESDCYKILDIPPDADERMIRKAFRAKAKEHHPDMDSSIQNTAGFILLKKAMDTLLDPASRLKHDRLFGYYEQPKNQQEHSKQEFSVYQREKAKHLVKEWSKDHEIAMRSREIQRTTAIKKVRRRMLSILLSMFALLLLFALLLFFFIHH